MNKYIGRNVKMIKRNYCSFFPIFDIGQVVTIVPKLCPPIIETII